MNIRLGLAHRKDAVAVAEMSRSLIEHGLPWTWNERRVLRCISHPDCVVLAARGGRRLVGFAIAEFFDDRMHLNLLAVRPAYQRMGIGRSLLAWLESSARTAGTFLLHVEVRASNVSARDFYKCLGFRENGARRGYYAGREDAVRLVRDLKVAYVSPVP